MKTQEREKRIVINESSELSFGFFSVLIQTSNKQVAYYLLLSSHKHSRLTAFVPDLQQLANTLSVWSENFHFEPSAIYESRGSKRN
jgi:hypothetical protein